MKVRKIPICNISVDPDQPRRFIDKIDELAISIRENGLLEPIVVRPDGENFIIVSGERRFRAVSQLGYKDIDAIIKDVTPREAFKLAFMENIQREDLNEIDEAEAFLKLTDMGMKQKEITALTGKSQSYISQKIRLLGLPDCVRFFIQKDLLTENHSRQLLRFKKIYPNRLMATPFQQSIKDIDFSDETQATSFITKLCPNYRSYTIKPVGSINHSLIMLQDYVLKHNYQILQWEKSAIYYAFVAVDKSFDVAILTAIVDSEQGCYEGCLYSYYFKGPPHKQDLEDHDYKWAEEYLAASNSLTLDPYVTHREYFSKLLDKIKESGRYDFPKKRGEWYHEQKRVEDNEKRGIFFTQKEVE